MRSTPSRDARAPSTSRSPSTLQRAPRAVAQVAARARSAARRARAARSRPRRRGRAPHHEVDALERRAQRALEPRDELARGARGRARRPAPSAAPGTARSRPRRGRAPLGGSDVRSRRRRRRGRSRRSTGACEWSATTITACSSRNASAPPRGVHQPLELAVGVRRSSRPARTGRACASACRCRAARAAGSRTGRARPGTRRRSRRAGRARPAGRAASGSRSSRLAKMSA